VLDASVLSDDPAANLQLGLAVELSVIPPYLYALWSLKPASEGASPAAVEAANTIRGVVYEEMLHAALVGNILNALKVKPDVTGLLMRKYPGPLPGHTTQAPYAYDVSLAALSCDTITTFLDIERPPWVKPEAATDDGWKTIADVYDKIIAELRSRNPSFTGGRQLPAGENPGPGRMIQVVDLKTAIDAIGIIIEQGEGHEHPSKGNPVAENDDDNELAHYDQFLAIENYLDDGSIDTMRDVYPVIDNPTASAYNAKQKLANQQFNQAYTDLLNSLQAMFNDTAPRAFGLPTDLMRDLEHRAAELRSLGPVGTSGCVAGPTFEYLGPAGGAA
jgi:Ferritin-like